MNFSIFPGKNVLLLGIGGSGMSSLGHILIDLGLIVYGYDKKQTDVTDYLKERGAIVFNRLDDIDITKINFIVFSSAINDKNHQIFQDVNKLSIPMFHRSDILHKVFAIGKSISVAGSHGKTSTTAMIAQILESHNLDPSVMIGGDTSILGKKGGKFGKGEYGVYESDESDGTFLKHKANLRIVTNVDNDHLDFYQTREKLESAFLEYIAPEFPGTVVLQGQDEGVQSVISLIPNIQNISKEFYLWLLLDEENGNSISQSITNLKMTLGERLKVIPYQFLEGSLQFYWENSLLILNLPFSGKHYLTNGLTAFVSTMQIAGLKSDTVIATLKKYEGVKRRQEILGNIDGVQVIDDYGHHPTEIRTVIQSLKQSSKEGTRVVVIFQAHRYTRTQNLQKELAEALHFSDYLFLLPIYSAGESPIPGISEKSIANHLTNQNFKLLSGNIIEDIKSIKKEIKTDDILLCLGAGNVREWGEALLKGN
ncbi:MAG: UDP-N-acetylmuramate--L-alanine ligase [Leptospira sp.]|nr:UDP-N-acetylmuramate--L-alanine ligase [Leptospira sp.]